MAQYMLGQQPEATRSLQKALTLNPVLASADEARRALAVLSVDPAAAAVIWPE